MKTTALLTLLGFTSLFLLSSCEEGFFDLTESFTFTHEFDFTSDSAAFTNTRVVDLTQESQLVAMNADKIKLIGVYAFTHNGPDYRV